MPLQLWASHPTSKSEDVAKDTVTVPKSTEAMRVQWLQKRLIVRIKPQKSEGAYALARRVLKDWRKDFENIPAFQNKEPLQLNQFVNFNFRMLKPALQKSALNLIFPNDAYTESAWVHHVTYPWESLSLISALFTENKATPQQLSSYNRKELNAYRRRHAAQGKKLVLLPWKWLPKEWKTQSISLKQPLYFQNHTQKKFAYYRIQKGESLYSSVIIRFTGVRLSKDVKPRLRQLLALNRIPSPSQIKENQAIKIPIAWISAEYLGSAPSKDIAPTTTVASQKKSILPLKKRAAPEARKKVLFSTLLKASSKKRVSEKKLSPLDKKTAIVRLQPLALRQKTVEKKALHAITPPQKTVEKKTDLSLAPQKIRPESKIIKKAPDETAVPAAKITPRKNRIRILASLPMEQENNNSISRANTIIHDQFEGRIGGKAGDSFDRSDYFKYDLKANGDLKFQITHDRTWSDFRTPFVQMFLYDETGSSLLDKITLNSSSKQSFTAKGLARGSYYIQVYSGVPYNNGAYAVQLKLIPAATSVTEEEPNDSSDKAMLLTDHEFSGTIGYKSNPTTFDSSDYFVYSLERAGDLSFQIIHDGTWYDSKKPYARVLFYDVTGKLITQIPMTSQGKDLFRITGLYAEAYYIRVYTSSPSRYGAYKVTLTPSADPFMELMQ